MLPKSFYATIPLFFLILFSCLFPLKSFAGQPGINVVNQPGALVDSTVSWVFYTPENPANLDANASSFTGKHLVVRLYANWDPFSKTMLDDPEGSAAQWAAVILKHSVITYVEPFNELEVDAERQGYSIPDAVDRAKRFITALRNALSGSGVEVTSPGFSSDANPQSKTVRDAFGDFMNTFNTISWHAYSIDEAKNYASVDPSWANKKFLITEFGVRDSGPLGAIYTDCAFVWFLCSGGGSNVASFWQGQSNVIAYFQWAIAPMSAGWSLSSSSPVIPADHNQCANITVPEDPKSNSCKQNLIFKEIPSTRDIGINGSTKINPGDRTGGPFWVNWFNPPKGNPGKDYNQSTDWGYGVPIADPFGNSDQPASIPHTVLTKWYEPDDTISHLVASLNETPHYIQTSGKQSTTYNYAAPNYETYYNLNGSGAASGASSKVNLQTIGDLKTSYNNFNSGSLPRAVPYQNNTDEDVNKWLCRLGGSNTTTRILDAQSDQVNDFPLGFVGDTTDSCYTTTLPNAGAGAIDRTVATGCQASTIITAKDIYCSQTPTNCSLPQNAVCNDYVHLTPGSELFKTKWAQLKMAILDNDTNLPSRAIVERCSVLPGIGNGKCQEMTTHPTIYTDLLEFTNYDQVTAIANKIITKDGGLYNKMKGGVCYSCKADVIYLPGLTQAAIAANKLGCGYATTLATHTSALKFDHVIDMRKNKPQLYTQYSDVSLGINNYQQRIDVTTFSTILDKIISLIFGKLQTPPCTINWLSRIIGKDQQGNDISKSYPGNSCNAGAAVPVETTLYTDDMPLMLYQCSKNLNTNLLPFKDNEKINQQPDTVMNFQSQYCDSLGTVDSPEGMFDNHKQDSNGGSNGCKQIPIGINKSDDRRTTLRSKYMLPLNWQGAYQL